jgi:hypothetical protein
MRFEELRLDNARPIRLGEIFELWFIEITRRTAEILAHY